MEREEWTLHGRYYKRTPFAELVQLIDMARSFPETLRNQVLTKGYDFETYDEIKRDFYPHVVESKTADMVCYLAFMGHPVPKTMMDSAREEVKALERGNSKEL